MLLVETDGGVNRKITGANARASLGGGGGGGVDFDTIPELTTLAVDDRVLVGDQSAGFSNKYLDAEDYATIIRPEVFHGLVRIGSGPSALNFDSAHFTVSGNNDGADIQLANVGGGGDTAQVTENVRVIEHILNRLADFDERVSDIDQTSVSDTQAFVTATNMKTTAGEPTNADRTTGTYAASLASITIGPSETGYVLFRIGIDAQPNLFEPQLRDTNNDTIIQNMTSLGYATELSPTATHRYFYLPLYFPIEDTGRLRLRQSTRTAHHDWLGTVRGEFTLFDGTHVLNNNMRMIDPVVVRPTDGLLEFMANGPATQRIGSAKFRPGWIPVRATIPTGVVNDNTANVGKFEIANRRLYMVWVTVGGEDRLAMSAQAGDTYNMVITHSN